MSKIKTEDLLKVKGAGFFSKWFKKILKIFKKVLKKLAKVLKKIAAVINKVLTTVFGKTIGGMLSSIINMPINFMATSMDLIAEGNFKGLLKHIGKMLIQVAMIVVMVVVSIFTAGAATALFGVLFQLLGQVLNFVGAALTAVGNFAAGFLGAIGGSIGSAIGGAIQAGLQFIGGALQSAGNFLISYGKELVKQGLSKFGNFASEFSQSLQSIINPLAGIQNIAQGATNIFTALQSGVQGLLQGSGQLLKPFVDTAIQYGLKVGEIFAKKAVDKQLQKKNMNSIVRSLLSTVVNAGISTLGSAVAAGVGAVTYKALGIDPNADKGPLLNQTQRSEAKEAEEAELTNLAKAEKINEKLYRFVDEQGNVTYTDEHGKPLTVLGNLDPKEFGNRPLSLREGVLAGTGDEIVDIDGRISGESSFARSILEPKDPSFTLGDSNIEENLGFSVLNDTVTGHFFSQGPHVKVKPGVSDTILGNYDSSIEATAATFGFQFNNTTSKNLGVNIEPTVLVTHGSFGGKFVNFLNFKGKALVSALEFRLKTESVLGPLKVNVTRTAHLPINQTFAK